MGCEKGFTILFDREFLQVVQGWLQKGVFFTGKVEDEPKLYNHR